FDLMIRRIVWFHGVEAQFGLSELQARTLLHMEPERPLMMSEVAHASGCEPSNLTSIIDKLEARGLVERRAAADDRRVKKVSMTRKGAELRKRLLTHFNEPARWMLALSAHEQRQLCEMLSRGLAVERANRSIPEPDEAISRMLAGASARSAHRSVQRRA
ncbi:MAG TPA: MarR family transcriptional regulator, partial [Candidatus Binataceae bacterium]